MIESDCSSFTGQKYVICSGLNPDGSAITMADELRGRYVAHWLRQQGSAGVGDTIQKVLEKTGLSKLADMYTFVSGKSCGCAARKEWLNRVFPYGSPEDQPAMNRKVITLPCSSSLEFQSERPIKSWAVGITTAPRARATLPASVASVLLNGWDPIIFAEPGSQLDDIPGSVASQVIHNDRKLGVWHNWLSCARTLLERYPDVDAYLTIQDDTVFHPQARWFAEHNFREPDRRIWSFYTPMHYGVRCDCLHPNGSVIKDGLSFLNARKWLTKSRRRNGAKIGCFDKVSGSHRVRTKSLWGACALVFHRSYLQSILDHKIATKWIGVRGRKMKVDAWRQRQSADPSRIQNSDTAIGKIAERMKLPLWFMIPSLADHVADNSADGVGHGGRGGRRSSCTFANGDLREIFK